jgi:hypothetical protein
MGRTVLRSWENLFSSADQLAQSYAQRTREAVGDFDPDTYLAKFNRTDIRSVHVGALGKYLL